MTESGQGSNRVAGRTSTRTIVLCIATCLGLLATLAITTGSDSAAAQDSEPEDRTVFWLFSEPGEVIGGATGNGLSASEVSATLTGANRVDVVIINPDGDGGYRLVIAAPFGEELEVGSYTNARESLHGQSTPTLQFQRLLIMDGRCPESFGLFEVLEVEIEDNQLVSFAADFQFSCNIEGEGPWSMGSIRWGSAEPLDFEASPDVLRIEGVVTGPDGAALRDVLACAGVRNETPAQARASNRCITTNRFGEYSIEVDITATGNPVDQGYGEFYVHYFPFAQNYLRHQCFSGLGGCFAVDFINLSKAIHVNSHIDAQLEYGCWEAAATILPNATAGVIEGTEEDDVIVAFDGDDTIFALGGNDIICTGNGDNVVFAGDGDDRIFGGIGDDQLSGQLGDDYLWGNLGDDRLRGGDGDDTLLGDSGVDNLAGGRDNDQLDGGFGEDTVRGGTGDDLVLGGPDADVLVAGNGGVDVVNGGSGDDLLITGGPRADKVYGEAGNDVAIKGLTGADAVFGGPGDDNLFGGRGTDSLDGGDGFDYCTGGNGFSDRAFDCEDVALVDNA